MSEQGAETECLPADAGGIARAAALLREGRLVAFPTETVYGLGADARNDAAVAAIFAAKGRPAFNPLIVHLAEAGAAEALAAFGPEARALAEAFWPGPLTLVLPLRAGHGLSARISAGRPTVALRVPDHPLARALLEAFGGPVAAPSANPSGRLSPTRAEHVLEGLSGRIAAVLDGGPCPVGLESSIVGLDASGAARLLRPGALSADLLARCIGRPLARPGPAGAEAEARGARGAGEGGMGEGGMGEGGAEIEAPGQLASHYAPRARLRLNASARRPGEALLGFGAMDCDLNLSPAGDLSEAAAALFDALRRLDAGGAEVIAVAPIPEHGIGAAINDRLRRAAAPRP